MANTTTNPQSSSLLLVCPFDSNHKMRSSRYLIHLKKCKSENRAEFVRCPFNQSHVVSHDQFESHLDVCENYHSTCRHIRYIARYFPENPINVPEQVEEEESKKVESEIDPSDCVMDINNNVDWEMLENVKTFKPLTTFQLQTLTKSLKKKYRLLLHNYNQSKNANSSQ